MNEKRCDCGWWNTAILLAFVIGTFCAPALGVFAKPDVWYQELQKPSWNPPGWVFGPVWTTLYLMMAVAAWWVWKQRGWGKEMRLYTMQLILNAAWTPVFFGAHQIGWALVVIVLLWLLVAGTLWIFYRVSKVSGALLVPYFLWLSFASVLNFTLWRLNASG